MKLVLFSFLSGLLMSPAFGAAVLTDDVHQLPPNEWRWVRFESHHRPATVECHFDTIGEGEAHAELVTRADLELFRDRKHHDAIATTDKLPSANFNQYLEESGEYAVVIENATDRPISVHLRVGLSFGTPKPVSRYLSPSRRLTVILVSFAMFFTIVTFSARALLKAMKKPN
jgi:hypothetical protein